MSAESMHLQISAVMDKESIDDEVGGLIQRRFSIGMDHAQFFVVHKTSIQEFSQQSILSNTYGSNSDSMASLDSGGNRLQFQCKSLSVHENGRKNFSVHAIRQTQSPPSQTQ